MFERYTEKARRVIFFARYEASQFGSPYIETEHLLLGLLREDKALTNRFLRSHASVESIRKQIEGHTTIREKVSTSVDLPLSNECKRVLAYAAEEATSFAQAHRDRTPASGIVAGREVLRRRDSARARSPAFHHS
jgi:ATP-dependent Clp protease ATP-binding subunit ClpC